jgi:hypothetical protein
METKICAGCKEDLILDRFCTDKKSGDGKQSYCKACKAEKIKKYYKENPHKKSKQSRESLRKKSLKQYYKDRVNMNFSRRMRATLRGLKAGASWESLVGYTVIDLKEHLESKFKPGMTWKNYGDWHIDHKTPVSKFIIKSVKDESFLECWSLKNLQPLWAIENLVKGKK